MAKGKKETEMVSVGTKIDAETLARLRAYSEDSGIPQAEIIRRAVRAWLEEKKSKEGKDENI